MYYDGKIFYGITDVAIRNIGLANLSTFGILPLVTNIPVHDNFLDLLVSQKPENTGNYYTQSYEPQARSVISLLQQLPVWQAELSKNFQTAFGEIDYRCSRATQDITARNTEIAAIEENLTKVTGQAAEELSLLRAELLKSNVSDGRVLVEMRQIAEANRDMQTELLALEITESMTLEEAQEITLRIANAKPWLPWRE